MAATKKRYTVEVERDEHGRWVGSVRGLRGVHTQARTLESLRERIAEAIAAADEPLGNIALKVDLPKMVDRQVDAARNARARAAVVNDEAQAAMRGAARELKRLGLSVRDAAALLGISHQRVQQLE